MRQKILDELFKHPQQYISGKVLAEQLGVSRVAVWKHITVLREMGYKIDSIRNKGYCLKQNQNIFSVEEYRKKLRTTFMGQEIRHYHLLDSTNQQAKLDIKEDNLPDGTVIVAGKQTQSRGRRGKIWDSPFGGLWFSVINRPNLPVYKIALLSLVYALAVANALEKLSEIKTAIKWPNDIFVKGKKISGILLELRGELEATEYLITGVGVNINIDKADFPDAISKQMTSLYNESGQFYSLGEVLAAILNSMEDYYQQFMLNGSKDILSEFKSRCYHLGKEVQIEVNGKTIKGINVDIDLMGNLLIDTGQKIESISTGDLQVLAND